MQTLPFVSIIIVNYNGKHLLLECLSSVFSITYPREKYEVIVVDNNSSDDSVPFIRSKFPQAILIESKENLGFTGGNKLGLSYSTGEYIVLLNSDTRVDPKWLDGLVTAAQDEKVGMVNSKLYFATPFLQVKLHSTVKMRSEIFGGADFSPVGVLVEDIYCSDNSTNSLVWYEEGFYEKVKGEIACRWTKGDATVLLPFNQSLDTNRYIVTIHGYPTTSDLKADFSFSVHDEVLLSDTIQSNKVEQYTLEIPAHFAKKNFIWLVQNAGNIVLSNGYGKDRGSLLYKGREKMEEFYERDTDVFSRREKLLACCGASVLIKRSVIDKVGFFDDDYYMYYEDLDLSLRVWRAGYDLLYEPSSVVYHKHKSTVQSTSNFSFLYHVEKNHLAFVFVHFPFFTIFTQIIGLTIRFTVAALFVTVYLFSENITAYEGWRQIYESRKRALLFTFGHFFSLLQKRNMIGEKSVRSFNEMRKFLY